jgi:hypothetical protein
MTENNAQEQAMAELLKEAESLLFDELKEVFMILSGELNQIKSSISCAPSLPVPALSSAE